MKCSHHTITGTVLMTHKIVVMSHGKHISDIATHFLAIVASSCLADCFTLYLSGIIQNEHQLNKVLNGFTVATSENGADPW